MTQPRRHSALEAATNVAAGYVIGLAAQLTLFPAVGLHASVRQNIALSVGFSVVSLVRGYVLRRWFNAVSAARAADRQGSR